MTDPTADAPAATPSVRAEVVDGVGLLTLDRPQAVNALDHAMVTALRHQLQTWADEDAVAAVWLQGAGDRGLCAGGDVRALRSLLVAGQEGAVLRFWEEEYALNALIAGYPKPFVAWMDGVVMGGGVGVSAHGSLRLVTERTRLAMPETIIGFFPDVGGLWFLAHAPGELGTHVALTGLPVTGADAVLLGLADQLVPSADREEVLADLRRAARQGRAAGWAPPGSHEVTPAPLQEHRGWIDICYAGQDAAAVLQALASHEDPAARDAAAVVASRSPHSVVGTLLALRRAAGLDVAGVLAQDARLGPVFTAHPDFVEGVRALLVDKDGSPRWAQAHVREVDTAALERALTPKS